MSDTVWVSAAYYDTTLIKPFNADVTLEDLGRAAELSRRHGRGEALSPDEFDRFRKQGGKRRLGRGMVPPRRQDNGMTRKGNRGQPLHGGTLTMEEMRGDIPSAPLPSRTVEAANLDRRTWCGAAGDRCG